MPDGQLLNIVVPPDIAEFIRSQIGKDALATSWPRLPPSASA